jgi:predicted ATPase
MRGEYQTAREFGEQCLHLAQNVQDPALLLEAQHTLGPTLLFLGELTLARAHLERGMALYDPQQHRSLAVLYGHDPGVCCRGLGALTLWLLGYPEQALQRSHEALTEAHGLAHPHSLAVALDQSAWLHQFRREWQAVQERAEATLALSTAQGFAQWSAPGTIRRGWALAERGQREEGIAQMRQGLAALQAINAQRARTYYLALLAETYGRGNEVEEGLGVLAAALTVAHKNGEGYYEAELYRLKGELLLRQAVPDEQEAETCFRQAIDVAGQQQAKSLGLRAAMSLARLWQQQGKQDETRELLAPIYGWFTEGVDTADLQEAKALLEELG